MMDIFVNIVDNFFSPKKAQSQMYDKVPNMPVGKTTLIGKLGKKLLTIFAKKLHRRFRKYASAFTTGISNFD